VVAAVAIESRVAGDARDRIFGERGRAVVAAAFVVAAYVGAAKAGLALSVAHGVISPVWPSAGIAVAALLLLGARCWPAVALGAFLANVTSGASPGVAAAIAVGNTLMALAAVYLLRRLDFRSSLERPRDVLWLVAVGFVCSTISATNGVTTLAVAGSPSASSYANAWTTWFLGDAAGVLLVAPAILAAAHHAPRLDRRERLEALALLVALVGASAIVFLGGLWHYPYPVFGLLVLATLRFRQLGAGVGSLVVAGIAVAGAVSGGSPLGADSTEAVQVVQAAVALVAVSLLVLGAALAEREQVSARLAEAQSLARLGSWEWDAKSGRVTGSKELFRILGLDPRSRFLTLDAFFDRVHPVDRAALRREAEEALATGSAFERDYRVVLDDGGEHVLHGRGRVVVDAAGRATGLVGTAQDVTERRRADEVRDNILSAVSHELRTPLTSILGFALTLEERRGGVSEELRQRMTSQLVAQALKLDRVLANILDVDRLRHGRLHLAVEPTEVSALVARTVAGIDDDGHRVDLDLIPIVADVDPARLERMVENLVANALKHTPPGTSVSVSLSHDTRDMLLCVDDSGPGVPDALKATIFAPFQRGNGSAVSGTGIGLALVDQFAALHGGRAWVEDGATGGASFRVSLPLRAQ
jgi:signal transduction histidine kinase